MQHYWQLSWALGHTLLYRKQANTPRHVIRPRRWRGTRGEWYVVGQLALIALMFLGPQTIPGHPAKPTPLRGSALPQALPLWLRVFPSFAQGCSDLAPTSRRYPTPRITPRSSTRRRIGLSRIQSLTCIVFLLYVLPGLVQVFERWEGCISSGPPGLAINTKSLSARADKTHSPRIRSRSGSGPPLIWPSVGSSGSDLRDHVDFPTSDAYQH